MLTIHHLAVSQSDRIVWMAEELGIPYNLKWYDRGEDMLAPETYRSLHPVGTAPVIEDDGQMLTESAVIVEHLSHKYAKGAMSVLCGQPDYLDYLYWMHFNNIIQPLFLMKMGITAQGGDAEANPIMTMVKRREETFYHYLDDHLKGRTFLVGNKFTCADIMLMFNVTALPLFGGRSVEDLPNVQTYVKHMAQRPAYQKAMAIAGPSAQKPS